MIKKRDHETPQFPAADRPDCRVESSVPRLEKRKPERKSDFLQGILILCGIGGATGLLYWSGIGCVWRFFFGIECPACGMTRAWLSFLHGDFSGAFRNHRMFWSVPILFLFILMDGHIFRKKWINTVLLSLIGAGFAVCYVLRLLGI